MRVPLHERSVLVEDHLDQMSSASFISSQILGSHLDRPAIAQPMPALKLACHILQRTGIRGGDAVFEHRILSAANVLVVQNGVERGQQYIRRDRAIRPSGKADAEL